MLTTSALASLFVVLVLVNVVLTSALGQHRTDVPRTAPPGSGPSWSWQVNLFVHAKYGARGRLIKRWIVALLAAQAVIAAVLVLRPFL
jgi:hypothetical protein